MNCHEATIREESVATLLVATTIFMYCYKNRINRKKIDSGKYIPVFVVYDKERKLMN